MTVYARQPHPATDRVGRGPGAEDWWAALPADLGRPGVARIRDTDHHLERLERSLATGQACRTTGQLSAARAFEHGQLDPDALDLLRYADLCDQQAARHLYLAQLSAALEDVTT